jgi:hypothetical protein
MSLAILLAIFGVLLALEGLRLMGLISAGLAILIVIGLATYYKHSGEIYKTYRPVNPEKDGAPLYCQTCGDVMVISDIDWKVSRYDAQTGKAIEETHSAQCDKNVNPRKDSHSGERTFDVTRIIATGEIKYKNGEKDKKQEYILSSDGEIIEVVDDNHDALNDNDDRLTGSMSTSK